MEKRPVMCAWHDAEQILNPSLWGEPVFGPIHVQDISTTHTVTSAGGSSPPDTTGESGEYLLPTKHTDVYLISPRSRFN